MRNSLQPEFVMQPIEYRRLGDPMIIRISVTLGLLFYVAHSRSSLHSQVRRTTYVCHEQDDSDQLSWL